MMGHVPRLKAHAHHACMLPPMCATWQVTGGARGIGLACGKVLASHGAKVRNQQC